MKRQYQPLSEEIWNELMDVRYEVSTTVTMKNTVLWDIETHFVPHRKYIHNVSAT
jgi:hypothetical protein